MFYAVAMTTSVKIGESAKDRLEQLQAEIRLETGTSVTQQDLLDRLIDRQYASREDIVDSYRDEWEGLSEDEIEQWLSGAGSWGDSDPSDLDEARYDDTYLAKKLGEADRS
jgi:hypothetical protein